MTQPSTSSTPISWEVITQTEGTKINAAGQAVEVVTVGFRLPTGQVGSVDVPLSGFTVDNVRAAIRAKAQTLLDVAGLTS